MLAVNSVFIIALALGCGDATIEVEADLTADPATEAAEAAEPVEAHAAAATEGPDALVERYLRLGSAGKLEEVAPLLEDGCTKAPLVNVASTHILGARIAIDKLSVEVKDQTDTEAVVAYALSGKAGGKGKVDTKVGKMTLKIEVAEVDANTEMSGQYTVLKTETGWRIACR